MKSRWVSLVGTAVSLIWVAGSSLYLYPEVKEEIEEKRYLHRVEKLHTPSCLPTVPEPVGSGTATTSGRTPNPVSAG